MSVGTNSRVGELRPSQLLWSFGIGSVVDLPNFSVMVQGLDEWDESRGQPIAEDRLLIAIRRSLGDQVTKLLGPPPAPESDGRYDPFSSEAQVGVPVVPFPEWFRCPICQLLARLNTRLFEFKANPWRPDRAMYVHTTCPRAKGKPPTAVPARFLVACERGHVDDFPWFYFVHRGQTGCTGTLRFYEVGASLETANLWVECNECGKKRSMVEAFSQREEPTLPRCRGRYPHLRDFEDGCEETLKAILLGASNSWFSETRTVLSVPTRSGKLGQLIEEKWAFLQNANTKEIVAAFLQTPGFGQLKQFDLDEVWAEVDARLSPADGDGDTVGEIDLKRPEWEVFSNPDPALNGSLFWLSETGAPTNYKEQIRSVVLAERLREVNALVGFTRLRSPGESSPGEARARRAPLSTQDPTWVPATEVRGEGVFIRFDSLHMNEWLVREATLVRERLLLRAHKEWRAARRLEPFDEDFPGGPYVLLHSLSHALMREFSLECGYNSASVRERIYASQSGGEMAGILIYTAAPDSEGTLGGLVSLGQPSELGRILHQALKRAEICASDPLCSEHDPSKDGTLHGASCHACLFAPETSCESGNRYLDRSVLVPTFRIMDAAFFPEDAE